MRDPGIAPAGAILSSPRGKSAGTSLSGPRNEKALLVEQGFLNWCPEEDSVTRARPRDCAGRRNPFESPREVRRDFPFWAENEKALLDEQGFLNWCPEEDSNLHSVATART